SSRRRHTRSKRDWSSDVCSSDLVAPVSSHHPTVGVGAPRVVLVLTGVGGGLEASQFNHPHPPLPLPTPTPPLLPATVAAAVLGGQVLAGGHGRLGHHDPRGYGRGHQSCRVPFDVFGVLGLVCGDGCDGGADLEGAVQGGSVGQADVGGVQEGAQGEVGAVVGPGDAWDGGVGDLRHPEGSGGPRLPGGRGGGQGWHVPVPDEHGVVGGQDCCGGEGGEVFGGIQCHAGHVAADPVQFGGGQVAGCFEHVPRVGGGGGYVLACGGD